MISNRHILTITLIAAFQAVPINQPLADTTAIRQDSLKTDHAEDTIKSLDKMVVTATRTQRRLSQIPASVSIIDKREMELSPVRNADDLIRNQPGVLVRRNVGMGEGVPGSIDIRGVPGAYAATRVLILVDGIPTNLSGAPFLIMNEVPIDAIERVEIVRGPFSSLYGANAFGGVINIVTRAGKGVPRVRINAEGGNWGFWDGNFWSGGEAGKFGYSASGGARGMDNYYARNYVIERHGDTLRHLPPDNHDYLDYRFLGTARYWFTDKIQLALQLRYFNSNLGFGKTKSLALNNPENPPNEDIVTKGQKYLVGPMISIKADDNTDIRVGGFVRELIGEFYNEALSQIAYDTSWFTTSTDSIMLVSPKWDSVRYEASYWKSKSDDGQFEAQGITRIGGINTITYGADFLLNRVNFGKTVSQITGQPLLYSYGTVKMITNTGIYAQDEIRFPGIATIVPGLRYDYHSTFGSVLSPKLGSSLEMLKVLHFRLSAGTAFRAPALSELYLPSLTLQPGIVMRSDSTLKPEHLFALDGGVDITSFKHAKLTVNGFYNYMQDLISPKISLGNAIGTADITFRNIARAWSTGTELSLETAIDPWMTFYLNYSYTLTRDEDLDTVLDFMPANKVGAKIQGRYILGNFTFAGEIAEDFVGPRTFLDWQGAGLDYVGGKLIPKRFLLDPYFRTDVNLRISYLDQIWLTIGAQNLFDAIYIESGGTLAPGRLISAKIGGEF